jgi:hypothetical protein
MLPPSLADENPYLVEVVVELGKPGYHYTGPESAWSNGSSTSSSASTADCAPASEPRGRTLPTRAGRSRCSVTGWLRERTPFLPLTARGVYQIRARVGDTRITYG